MLKKYRVTFNSGDENASRVHIRDTIIKFPANDDGLYLSKLDKIFLVKLPKRTKVKWLKD